MLNLRNAFRLYEILAPVLPERVEYGSLVSLVEQIMNNIRDKKEYQRYTEALELLTGKSFNELTTNSTPLDVLIIFSNKLMENNIHDLVEFCRRLGL